MSAFLHICFVSYFNVEYIAQSESEKMHIRNLFKKCAVLIQESTATHKEFQKFGENKPLAACPVQTASSAIRNPS